MTQELKERATERVREADMFTLLVTGSRFQRNAEIVWLPLFVMLNRHEQMIVRHGASPKGGVDAFASSWCRLDGQPWNTDPHSKFLVIEDAMPADWERLGKAAGPVRNQAMVDKGADACFGFPDDRPRSGTLDCMARAWVKGIPVFRFNNSRVGAYHQLSESEGAALAHRMLGWGS